jgi:hypothetical protein
MLADIDTDLCASGQRDFDHRFFCTKDKGGGFFLRH